MPAPEHRVHRAVVTWLGQRQRPRSRKICSVQPLPEIAARLVGDSSVPRSARFALQRLAEALDPLSPLMHSAAVHNDPRIVVRDLFAAIVWFDGATSATEKRQRWALLMPRLRRLQALIQHDQSVRRWYAPEVNAFVAAAGMLPSNPHASDWAGTGGAITSATRGLRDVLLHDTNGYRRRLTGTVAAAFAGNVVSPEAFRRLDERIGLLASMLLDEGRGREEVIETLAQGLFHSAAANWTTAATRALSGGWREYEVVAATSGFHPRAWAQPALGGVRPMRLGAVTGLVQRGWPARSTLLFFAGAKRHGADGLVVVTTRARDKAHAVRLARNEALRAADHQSAAGPRPRPTPTDEPRSSPRLRNRERDEAATLVALRESACARSGHRRWTDELFASCGQHGIRGRTSPPGLDWPGVLGRRAQRVGHRATSSRARAS